MPVDLKRYPLDWKQISHKIRFERAKSMCEWPGCTAEHGKPNPVTGSKVILTTAHLPIDANGILCDVHDKMQCSEYRLLALCQAHHLRLDGQEHARNAAITRRKKHESINPPMDL